MNKILVSYVLPCYNTGQYVITCLDSLYRQGLKPEDFEIICVNDCSLDNVADVISKYANTHSEVTLINHNKNLGSGGAYQTGLDAARGKYVQFVDSDDYLADNAMPELLKIAEEENLEMLYFNLDSFNSDGFSHKDDLEYNGNFPRSLEAMTGYEFIKAYSKLMTYQLMPVPAYRKLILRELFTKNNIRFTPTTLQVDFLNNIDLLSFAKRVKAITDKHYCFRINENGVTGSKMTVAKNIYSINNSCLAFYGAMRIMNQDAEAGKIVLDEVRRDVIGALYGSLEFSQKDCKTIQRSLQCRLIAFSMAPDTGIGWSILFPFLPWRETKPSKVFRHAQRLVKRILNRIYQII